MFDERQNRKPETQWAGWASEPAVNPSANVPCASRTPNGTPAPPAAAPARRKRDSVASSHPPSLPPGRTSQPKKRTHRLARQRPSISCAVLLHKSATLRLSIDSRQRRLLKCDLLVSANRAPSAAEVGSVGKGKGSFAFRQTDVLPPGRRWLCSHRQKTKTAAERGQEKENATYEILETPIRMGQRPGVGNDTHLSGHYLGPDQWRDHDRNAL
jgi:hypothetical protein